MKPSPPLPAQNKGSALLTVVMLTAIMAVLTASMLTYTMSERKGNERNRLILRAKNMSENITIYAAEQLTTKLYRLGSAPVGIFPYTGTSRNRVYMPPDQVLDTDFTNHSTAEMRAGIQTASSLALETDTSSPNYGLQVSTALIPIIAKITASHAILGNVTAYVEQDMSLALTPLFQFGMFYNMDLELYPSKDFTLAGPVHTNGRLMAHPDGASTTSIIFTDRVTSAGALYADSALKTVTRGGGGTATAVTLANGNVVFYHTNGTTTTSLKNGSNQWRDHKYTTTAETTSTIANFKTFATTTYNGNLRTSAHGVTKLELPGIGSYKEQDDPSTPGVDERSNGREIIEPPNAKKWVYNTSTSTGSWTANTDPPDAKESKLSWKCGLYIMVNPSNAIRSATAPDASTKYVLPYAYRSFLNILNTSTGVRTVTEVILPGQPTYGYNNGADATAGTADDYMYQNNLPNRYVGNSIDATNWPNITAVGTNQVLRITQQLNAPVGTPAYAAGTVPNANPVPGTGYATTGGTGSTFPADAATMIYPAEAYFWDMRRANSNRGVISISGTQAYYDRQSVNYVPRPISKIDFDHTRFKMMVERVINAGTTCSVYDPRAPNVGGTMDFTKSIYAVSPTGTVAFGLGIGPGFATFPTSTSVATRTLQDPFQLYYAPTTPTAAATITVIGDNPISFAVPAADLYHASTSCAWNDGIAVYLHSMDAEIRAQSSGVPGRIDSGVRFWNARGPIATLAVTGKTGFTFVTNDACYIIGHFNANGGINDTVTSTGNGGYSARWPDSTSEKLSAVMGDSINILSAPTWSSTTSGQVNGWNDALSALPASASSSGWRTGSSATDTLTGGQDGVYTTTTTKPGLLPTSSTPGTPGTAVAVKLAAVDTEVSTALLVGIVPTNHDARQLTDGYVPAWSHAATGDPLIVGNRTNGGGANNFPRLLCNWSSADLFIRGSIVGMFESRVAMEPFTNSRCYSAPGRYWGLHQNFRTVAHDLPLEPIVLGSTRVGFRELTAAQYASMKTALQALTALP